MQLLLFMLLLKTCLLMLLEDALIVLLPEPEY